MTDPMPFGTLAQSSVPMVPAVLLVLCVVGGIGTVLLLPSRREASLRKIGAVILLTAGLIFAALLVRWTAGRAEGGMGAYFWIFSTIALAGSVRVVTHTRPVYSALYFVLTVLATAGLFVLLGAEFMAAALVLIYAGAILVTYVFVIMLAAEATGPGRGVGAIAEHDAVSREPLAASAVGFALMGVLLFVIFDKYQQLPRQNAAAASTVVSGSTQQLGAFLFKEQVVNLELAGLILTVALVGAIIIARRKVHADAGDEMIVLGPPTPQDDNPHNVPVYGTSNPRQKAYPER